MISIQAFGRVVATLAVALMVMMTVVDFAEARRGGGGFGSRGTRTFSTPSTTRTAPTDAQPIDRTMTRQSAQPSTSRNTTATNPRPGLFGGFGGSLLGGLMVGGLVGMLLGNGLGGGIGFLGLILQVLLIAGVFMFLRRMFAQKNATAYAGGMNARSSSQQDTGRDFAIPRIGGGNAQPASRAGGLAAGRPAVAPKGGDEIGIQQRDLDQFESMLKELQAAYAAEDFSTLRQITTPEAMSYLAEELGDNATQGVKNEVRDVHLVSGDIAEAWREGGDEYATVAMRYESIDVMRERATGRVVSGDPDTLTEAVEIWTFLRRDGGDWKVSAIQGVEAA